MSQMEVLDGAPDRMRAPAAGGGTAAAATRAPEHPVEELQRADRERDREWRERLQRARNTAGPGLAMRLASERECLQRNHVGGEPGIAEDVITGRDADIRFEDFMGLPEGRPEEISLEGERREGLEQAFCI